MMLFSRPQPRPAAQPADRADTVRATTALIPRHDLLPVAAAWPAGVSQLAQAIDACQRCDTAAVCTDWLRHAPNSTVLPPPFCPNAADFKRAKQA
jgi:hypothetical protein